MNYKKTTLFRILFFVTIFGSSCAIQSVTEDFTYPYKIRIDTIHSNAKITYLKTSSMCGEHLSIATALQREKQIITDFQIRDRLALINVTQQKSYTKW